MASSLAACATGAKAEENRQTIRQVVKSNIKDIERCYLETIDRRPGAEGKLVAAWIIMPDGSVADARIKSKDPRLEGIDECILQEVGSWKFAKNPNAEELDVEGYPFYFSENGSYRPLEEQ
jgi:hypothetical protein